MLTRDPSLVEQMVSEGYISRREARVHPQRNVILRALGVAEDLEIDRDSMVILPRDKILLCSDGLSGALEDEEIASFLSREDDPEHGCRDLIQEAKDKGATDDITVVLVELDSETPEGGLDSDKGKKAW